MTRRPLNEGGGERNRTRERLALSHKRPVAALWHTFPRSLHHHRTAVKPFL